MFSPCHVSLNYIIYSSGQCTHITQNRSNHHGKIIFFIPLRSMCVFYLEIEGIRLTKISLFTFRTTSKIDCTITMNYDYREK